MVISRPIVRNVAPAKGLSVVGCRCDASRYGHENHELGCPSTYPLAQQPAAAAAFGLGYRYGRSGEREDSCFRAGPEAAWNLGKGFGIVALEEFENGERPDYD